uniref:Uncharacterized protein n=1 Tax=Oryza barthii TaxID=65489 RepID=A0A0D3FU83_9ORYZ
MAVRHRLTPAAQESGSVVEGGCTRDRAGRTAQLAAQMRGAGRLRGTDARDRAGHAGPCWSRSAVLRDRPPVRPCEAVPHGCPARPPVPRNGKAAPPPSRIPITRRRYICANIFNACI